MGRLAYIKVKLGLSEKELMESSWIKLNLMMYDFPFYDPKAKKLISGQKAIDILDKYAK